jgi:hypothetical protein
MSSHFEGSGRLNCKWLEYDDKANRRLSIKEHRHHVIYEGRWRDKRPDASI